MLGVQDDDGTGYVFYCSEWNGRIRAARLDMDLANVQQHFADILYGMSREAPVIFKAYNHYFMLVSGVPRSSSAHKHAHCMYALSMKVIIAQGLSVRVASNHPTTQHAVIARVLQLAAR